MTKILITMIVCLTVLALYRGGNLWAAAAVAMTGLIALAIVNLFGKQDELPSFLRKFLP